MIKELSEEESVVKAEPSHILTMYYQLVFKFANIYLLFTMFQKKKMSWMLRIQNNREICFCSHSLHFSFNYSYCTYELFKKLHAVNYLIVWDIILNWILCVCLEWKRNKTKQEQCWVERKVNGVDLTDFFVVTIRCHKWANCSE